MTLVRINPYAELAKVAKRFQEFSNNLAEEQKNEITYSVRADIAEDDKAVMINLELPGVSKQDINIAVDNDRKLIIKGEKKRNEDYSNRNLIRSEINSGKFYRSFVLANDLDETQVNAKFENGLLTLSIPKKKKEEIEKEITIN